MQIKMTAITAVLLLTASQLMSQYAKEDTFKDSFVGSALFMLGNLDSKNRPDFAQLNLGYRITGIDVVFLELKSLSIY